MKGAIGGRGILVAVTLGMAGCDSTTNKEDTGAQRHTPCEKEHGKADPHLPLAGKQVGPCRQETTQGEVGQRHTQDASHQGQEDALHQKLADDSAASRPQGEANGEFPAPARGSRQGHVGQIRAGDEENHPRYTQEKKELGS